MTRRAAPRTFARPVLPVIALLLAEFAGLTLVVSRPAEVRADPAPPTVPLPSPTVPAGPLAPTTVPPTTTVPADPSVHPDLAVRRAPAGAWLGTGTRASRGPVTIDAPARAGQPVTFVLRVRHDGATPTELTLSGQGADRRAEVVWRLDGQDVTDEIDDGELHLLVDPGDHRDLTLRVTLGPSAPAGFALTRTLTAESPAGDARDRIRTVVTRGPAPVRFHDVGPALGLPGHTHSFDIDVASVDADGIDDLVLSTHGRVEVFLNRRPGLEVALTRSGGDIHACAVGDANGDARADVYCTVGAENGRGSKHNRLWLQAPDGGFGTNLAVQYGVDDPYGRGRHPTFVDLDHRLGLDLFVGNENPRSDDNLSVNRTFLNDGPEGFSDVRLGMARDIGGLCVQAADQDRDGWDDLLVCGGAGPATVGWHPTANRLHLFRSVRQGDSRRLLDVAPRLGIDLDGIQFARLAHLDGDRQLDLVVVGRNSVSIWPGTAEGGFGLPVWRQSLRSGHAVALADVDGRHGLDLFVVQGCTAPGGPNVEDLLLLDTGAGWDWDEARLPTRVPGCGDTAEALDVDGDGVDDLVVGNGQWSAEGPVQVLTSGRYWG